MGGWGWGFGDVKGVGGGGDTKDSGGLQKSLHQAGRVERRTEG